MPEGELSFLQFNNIMNYGIEYVMDSREILQKLNSYISYKQTQDNAFIEMLINSKEPYSKDFNNMYNLSHDFNASQAAAIKKSLNQKITFFWGPPGTGKTKTLGKIASILALAGKRVLLTALSNKALDQLLISSVKPITPLGAYRMDVSRLGNSDTVENTCKVFTKDYFFKNRVSYKWEEYVKKSIIVAANYASLFTLRFDIGNFDYIISDEISMTQIPYIVASSFYANSGLILGGDPVQLPPIFPEDADMPNEWFSKNIFEKAEIKSHDDPRVAFLNTQYRMQPKIGDLVSNIFYGGKLKTGTEKKELKSEFSSNIIFVNEIGKIEAVAGNIISEKEERRYNSGHSAIIAEYVIKLIKNYSPSDIGVIAPYNAQVVKIKEYIKKKATTAGISEDTINKVQVSTIHSFQGQEKSAIIMNICDVNVRPTRLTAKRELINVAISRAKELLIIIGNKDYLLNKDFFSENEVEMFKTIIDNSELIN